VLLASLPAPLHAEEALIAVATNFIVVAERLKVVFELETDHRITIVGGSTGKLYAQVLNGAPYDVLLAADQERPMILEKNGRAVEGSRFTFATGQLALWSANVHTIRDDVRSTVLNSGINALAIANPALAPYGAASREALQSLDIWEDVRDRIVMGENVGQAHALVATGNAEVGIVALSLMLNRDNRFVGDYLEIPRDLHTSLRQDAVLLRHGEANIAAKAFLRFMQSEETQVMLLASGYGVD